MNGWVGLAVLATWLLVAFTTRYSSLSAITVSILAPVYVWWFTHEPVLILATLVMALLLLWRHRSNIRNLLAGTETKIGR
jgi:acyl phosphate:glycerol-3-phosphate acyltransferase